MKTIDATLPILAPPTWAVLERQLIAAMDQSVDRFVASYVRPDGTLAWDDRHAGRVRSDAFYESIHNWPLFYALGGGDHVLPLATRVWDGITRQLSSYGILSREYDRGLDWFHQAEGNLFFYYLCLADPGRAENRERALRFAGFFTGADPDAPNYDPDMRLIRSPRTGSLGPRVGLGDGGPSYGWSPGMVPYGLPYTDVPGIASYEDLRDPVLARRMGQIMHERMGRGDAAANLPSTTLVTNAFLLTGDDRYRRWVVDYVDAWVERAQRNGGLLPDTIGLSGEIGEYLGGKWYGGLYGWTWPHGFYNIAMGACVAAANAYLLTGDSGYLDLPRTQIDRVLELGELRDPRLEPMSLRDHWIDHWLALPEGAPTFLVPYRFGDQGWFDYQPPCLSFPVTVWSLSSAPADWDRLERIRAVGGYDWRRVFSFRNKEENGHEAPWVRFLAGDNPGYPEEILREAYGQVLWHADLIRSDPIDLEQLDKHHFCNRNPVFTEALVQLTLGAPQTLYNAGLPVARVRYYDGERHRAGLPTDVAALVEKVEADRVVVHLVNLSLAQEHEVVVRAGAFGEHQFTTVRYTAGVDPGVYPGRGDGYVDGTYAPPDPHVEQRGLPVDDSYLAVRMRPASQITLDLGTARFVNRPSYEGPW
jgi:hypothetical protein